MPGGSAMKNMPDNAENKDSIPGSGRSLGKENGNPLHYSCLGNSMDRGDWQAIAHGVERVRNDWATEHEQDSKIWLEQSMRKKVECKITLLILSREAWDDSFKNEFSSTLSGNTQQKVGNVGENLWEYKMGSYQYKVKN